MEYQIAVTNDQIIDKDGPGVAYWDPTTGTNATVMNATKLTSAQNYYLRDEWYYVGGKVTIGDRLFVDGTYANDSVNLILKDGAELDCKGGVSIGTTTKPFKIWAQSEGDNVGRLYAQRDKNHITVRLYANGKEVDSRRVTEATDHNNWAWLFDNLPKNEAGMKVVYTVTEDSVPNYTTAYTLTNDKQITITNTCNEETKGKTQVTVHQVWADYNNQDGLRPNNVTVRLFANGVDTKKTVTLGIGQTPGILTTNDVAADDIMWYDAFQNLDVTDDQGKAIVYSVHEDDEPDLYTTYYYGYAKRGFTIVGEHEPDTVSVKGSKVWDDQDNLDGTRPQSITVRLLADGKVTKTTDVIANIAGNEWQWEFADLPKKVDGNDVKYKVEEVPVFGYKSEVKGTVADGFTITNTHVPFTKTVTGTKTWNDDNNADGLRPEHITINLMADGNKVDKAIVSEDHDGNWTWMFVNLPADDAGKAITYEVTEEPVGEDYTTTYADPVDVGKNHITCDVTNTHASSKTKVTGTKTWDDANDQDGIRPNSVTIRLYADGKEVASKSVTAQDSSAESSNAWEWSFDDLLLNKNGTKIAYTVTEDAVDGYTTAIDGYSVTNTHTPGTNPDPTPDKVKHTITYKLNGGTYDGSTKDIVETHTEGEVISIHKAPARTGYTFTYWKGSAYKPGDSYTVKEDHTFVAQWKENGKPTPTPSKSSGTSTTNNRTTGGSATTSRAATAKTGDVSASPLVFMMLGVAALAIAKRRRDA